MSIEMAATTTGMGASIAQMTGPKSGSVSPIEARPQVVALIYPGPPFAAGTPEQAGSGLTQKLLEIRGAAIAAAKEAAVRAGARLASTRTIA